MTYGFRRSRSGIAADLSEAEREILLGLLQQTMALLEDVAGGAAEPAQQHDADVVDGQGAGASDGTDDQGQPDEFEAMMRRAGFGGEEDTTTGVVSAPVHLDDSAVQRLLPDGHHDDPEMAAEFRRLTGNSVRDRKLRHLRTAVQVVAGAQGGRMRLADAEATSLLIAMTDVRLVLADRLDLDDDEAAESLSDEVAAMDQDDPRFALALGYEFLTWLQESLAVALTP